MASGVICVGVGGGRVGPGDVLSGFPPVLSVAMFMYRDIARHLPPLSRRGRGVVSLA